MSHVQQECRTWLILFGFSVFIIILKHSPNKAPIKICYAVVINTDEGDKHEKNYDFTDEVF